jgi:phosphate transport system substrate-binding protein
VLADIFLCKITQWDDKPLVELNQQAKLPAKPIAVIHQSDDSGTTAIWTNYLSKVSPEWREQVGEGSTVRWPVGKEARGDQGVVDLVRRTENSLTYVELAYAFTNRMTFGSVRNKAGQLLAPSLSSTAKAFEAALPIIPDDYLMFITNPDAGFAYPIAGVTYLVVYADQTDPDKGRALSQFLWWATHEGQKYALAYLYAPLPRQLVDKVERTLKTLTVNGQPAFP